jgi:hypothetical protein
MLVGQLIEAYVSATRKGPLKDEMSDLTGQECNLVKEATRVMSCMLQGLHPSAACQHDQVPVDLRFELMKKYDLLQPSTYRCHGH